MNARDRYQNHTYSQGRDRGRAEHAAQDMAEYALMGGPRVTVEWHPNNHGYPYRASCQCGWQSLGYVAQHAAHNMADDHRKTVHGLSIFQGR